MKWLVITHTASEKNFRLANFYSVEDMNGDEPLAAVALSTWWQKKGGKV
jgi:hypothetical protein